ncbi:Crp/Fnr family transcriptional regulator [Geosporobacter ferrireducens]|uniref:cAMP-binding protein n=1 Tax=Geosporobacter ferrireducens TaxID=1424294 RepID=A0A1D8GDH0_9FIRM|nr:Crp/Fnr family transcriptional regulator [Geosporobacter ferrireducens]AOT68947.1 hypothetical protein Gferi_04885 [Geosporobacter ferrireducens]
MNLKEYTHVLRRMELFSSFEPKHLIEFFNRVDYFISSYKKSSIIFMQGDFCTTLNVVLKGTVEIQKIDPSGKILTITVFNPGDTFGDNLIFGDINIVPMTIVVKKDAVILCIPKETIIQLCQTNQAFLYGFLKLISNKSLTLSSKITQVVLKTIRQKICEFLLLQYSAQKSLEIKIGMKKREWADSIGVQRPSLSRELMKMKKENLIDYDNKTIYIKNLKSIEKCALY